MKNDYLKHSVALNLLSFLGYLCFIITLLFCIIIIPVVKQMNYQAHDSSFEFFLIFGVKLITFYSFHLLIAIILILFAGIEWLFYKRGKAIEIDTSKIPPLILNVHPYLFWVGIFLVFMPFYWLIIIYVLPAIISIFLTLN
jgi:cbb3-type cytochrome oxidase subunit 3